MHLDHMNSDRGVVWVILGMDLKTLHKVCHSKTVAVRSIHLTYCKTDVKIELNQPDRQGNYTVTIDGKEEFMICPIEVAKSSDHL